MTDRQFELLVREARGYYLKQKNYRFKIAEIAIRACDIEHGGRRGKGSQDNRFTVARFAQAVGLNKKTVYEWVRAKRMVVDKLPVKIREKLSDKDFDAINRTMARVNWNMTPKQIAIYYREESSVDPIQLKFDKYQRHLSSIIYNLKRTHNMIDVTEEILLTTQKNAQLIVNLINVELDFRKKYGKSKHETLVIREAKAKQAVKDIILEN